MSPHKPQQHGPSFIKGLIRAVKSRNPILTLGIFFAFALTAVGVAGTIGYLANQPQELAQAAETGGVLTKSGTGPGGSDSTITMSDPEGSADVDWVIEYDNNTGRTEAAEIKDFPQLHNGGMYVRDSMSAMPPGWIAQYDSEPQGGWDDGQTSDNIYGFRLFNPSLPDPDTAVLGKLGAEIGVGDVAPSVGGDGYTPIIHGTKVYT